MRRSRRKMSSPTTPETRHHEIADGGLDFRCKNCGCTDLIIEDEYTAVEEFVNTLGCDCEDGPSDGIAATFTNVVRTQLSERGVLDEDHRAQEWEKSEETGDAETECIEHEVYCQECYESADQNDWEIHNNPEDDETEDSEFFVRCAGCDREIEFGWSHPDRGGRIWPAESKDFNPWKSWPEPRYRESWAKKGWFRPNGQRRCA
jgi:hypothetical protein